MMHPSMPCQWKTVRLWKQQRYSISLNDTRRDYPGTDRWSQYRLVVLAARWNTLDGMALVIVKTNLLIASRRWWQELQSNGVCSSLSVNIMPYIHCTHNTHFNWLICWTSKMVEEKKCQRQICLRQATAPSDLSPPKWSSMQGRFPVCASVKLKGSNSLRHVANVSSLAAPFHLQLMMLCLTAVQFTCGHTPFLCAVKHL